MKTSSPFKMTIVAMLVASSMLLTGCNQANSTTATTTAEAIAAIPVEAVLSRNGEISSSYRTTSTLEARAEAEVISKTTGIV